MLHAGRSRRRLLGFGRCRIVVVDRRLACDELVRALRVLSRSLGRREVGGVARSRLRCGMEGPVAVHAGFDDGGWRRMVRSVLIRWRIEGFVRSSLLLSPTFNRFAAHANERVYDGVAMVNETISRYGVIHMDS